MNTLTNTNSKILSVVLIFCLSISLQAQISISYQTEIFTCSFLSEESAQFSCPFNGTVSVEVVGVSPEVFFIFESTDVIDGAFSFDYQLFAVAPTTIELIWTIETSDDVTGCALPGTVINSTISVDCLCSPIFSSDITHESCFGCNDGIVELEVSGMLEPYTYEWPDGRTSAFETDLAPGTYNVTVTGSNAIECSGNVIVIVDPYECVQTTVEYGTEPIGCSNDCDGRIEIFGLSNGDDFEEVLWEDGSEEVIRENLCAGLYLLDLIKGDNCVYSADIEIVAPEVLSLSIKEIVDTNGDNGGSIITAVEGGTPPYSYFISQNGEQLDHDPFSNEFNDLAFGCYDIMVLDNNECSSFLDSVCVDNISSTVHLPSSLFKVYPNPCVDYIEIAKENTYTIQSVFILNSMGEQMNYYTNTNTNTNKINVSHLQSGVYILKILTDQGFWTQTFVKNTN